MTREEAKELLTHILMTYEPRDQYGDLDDPEPYEQAVTMAIEALSAEAKGRVISAEKLKRMKFVAIKGDKTEEAYRTGWNGAIDCVMGEYASAEAVQGEWIPFDRTYGRSIWVCSACDNGTYVPCDAFTQKPIYDYCPNCGAKMRREDGEA